MASIAEINVRIGARIQDLTRNLNKAERRLRASARKMSQLGNEMTQMISLPIIGIGAAAIKSAGDMEQLENGLKAIMGDATAAAKELQLLKEVSQNPGLGFTQAVKGSVRLQSVGLSAELARKALANFGNAIALAGGSATDLDGVSLALTQIISKGKISAEEINQLAERVPQVRKAIKDGFGTADSEELQKLGISAEEFVEKVINEMGKLPKATGGIKNAITNAGIAITTFLSDLGKEIDTTFDVQGMVKRFSDTLNDLAEKFKALDKDTKKTILQVVAFVAAIGPAIKVVATLKNVYAGAISAVGALVGTFKSISSAVLVAAANFQKLNLVMKASVIGAVVAAVTAAVVIFKDWNSQLSESQRIQKTLTSVNTKAAQSIVEQKMKVEQLAKAVQDETKSEKERLSALNELQRISPKHFGNLDLEKGKFDDLTKSVEDYTGSILAMANIQAASEKIIELKKELLDTEKVLDQTKPAWTDFEAIQIRMTKFGESRREALAKLWAGNAKKYKESLNSQVVALTETIKKEEELLKQRGEIAGENLNNDDDTNNKDSELVKKLKARIVTLQNEIKELKNNSDTPVREKVNFQGIQTIEEQKDKSRFVAQSLVDAFTEASAAGQAFQKQTAANAEGLRAINMAMAAGPEFMAAYQKATGQTAEELAAWLERQKKIEEAIERMNQAAMNAKNSMMDYAAQGGKSLKELGKIALKSAADFVRAEMMKAIASFIQKTIAISGPFGIVAAGAGAAIVGALFNKAISSAGIPAFADGVNNFSGGVALVGERGPELVNLPRGSDVIPNHKLGGMNGKIQVEVIGRVAGDDLLLVMDRASQNRMRTSGY